MDRRRVVEDFPYWIKFLDDKEKDELLAQDKPRSLGAENNDYSK